MSLRRAWSAGVARLVLVAALACAAACAPAGVAQRLGALEQAGRARPEQAIAELEVLLDTASPSAPERLRALVLQGILASHLPDADAVERCAQRIEALPLPPDQVQAGAAAVRAALLLDEGPLGRADRLLAKALSQLGVDAPRALRLRLLALHAAAMDRRGQFDDAVRLWQQAIVLAETHAPAWQLGELHSSLAYTLWQAGQRARALAVNAEALRLAGSVDDAVALSAAHTTQSLMLEGEPDAEAERAAMEAAIVQARRAGSRRIEGLALANLTDHYLKRGQYVVAYERAQQALALARELRQSGSEAVALVNSGLALVALGRKAEGVALVESGMAIEERAGALGGVARILAELGHFLELAGERAEALRAYHRHRQLADEVFHREQQQAVLELQEAFDSARRDRELALLNRENRIKDEQLLQRGLQQRLWAAGAVGGALLLALLALLYRRLRERNAALLSRNATLKVRSERDPLTDLANRRALHAAMAERADDGTLVGTVFLVDVDHFKRINDRHGHAAGDAVLVELARRLKQTLRDDDLVVRWGGEEFLVVVRALAPEQVDALATRLLGLAAEPVTVDGRDIAVTASIGFASFPLAPSQLLLPWAQAVDLVDAAMYLAKAHGRNRAFGVRLVDADDAGQVDELARRLEAAWREGRVTLSVLPGPQVSHG